MSDKIEDRLEYILNQQREISAHLYRRDSTVYRVLATIFVIALACFVGWQEKEIYDARKTIDELNGKMHEVGAISGDLKKEIREELMQTFRQDIEEELQKGVEQMSKIYTREINDAQKASDELKKEMSEIHAVSDKLKKEIRQDLTVMLQKDVEQELQKGKVEMNKICDEEVRKAQNSIDELKKEIHGLDALSDKLKREIRQDLAQTLQKDIEQVLQKGMAQMSKIYTYDLDKTLRGVKIDEFNREFEAKIKVLNEEVENAKKKIASLKEGKDKDNFSEVYLKSLKFKRDTMLQEYAGTIEKLTTEINRVITEIAKEKDALVVLDKRIVASQTDNIEDITDEAIKRVKFPRPKFLDE